MKKTKQAVPNKLLREARKSRGWTQREVAERIGAPHPFIVNRWERGMNTPSAHYLQRLTDIFGKSLSELGLYEEDEDEDKEDKGTQQDINEVISYRGIMGLLPRTHESVILQRQQAVAEIYEYLTLSETTAVVVTGISGVGKSTLVAQVFNAVEERRMRGEGFFQEQSLWLRVDENVSLLDIANTIFNALGHKDDDFFRYSPQQQAHSLFHTLNTLNNPRLIVLDQFENLLNLQTGHPTTPHSGIRELIEALSNQSCKCRVILTSRIWPRESYTAPELYMKRYALDGLEAAEGIALLQQHGAQGTDSELGKAVRKCGGHIYALVLLAALMREYAMDMAQVLDDPTLWSEDIASEFLNHILEALQPVHYEILCAFAIYRETVPLEAIQTVLADISKKQLLLAIRTLRLQHLLLPLRDGHFQIHALIIEHITNRQQDSGNQKGQADSRTLHARAAQYYLQRAMERNSFQEQRGNISCAYPFIEALWHLCQAEQWVEAYALLERENLFVDLHQNGGDAALLEIYQLLLPTERWDASAEQKLSVYIQASKCSHAIGQLEQARFYGEKALQIARMSGARRKEIQLHLHIGELLDDQGRKDQAQLYYEQGLKISEEVQDLSGQGRAHSCLGWLFNNYYGDYAQAHKHLEQALFLFQHCQDRSGEAWALARLGVVYRYSGNAQRAREHYEQARILFEEVGESGSAIWQIGNLGELYRHMGQYQQAIMCLEQALERFRDLKAQRGVAWVLYRLSIVFTETQHHTQALACLEEAFVLFNEIGDRIGSGCVHSRLGITYYYMQQSEKAHQYFQQSLTILRATGDKHAEAEALCNLGIYYSEQHSYLFALAAFCVAKRLFTQVHSLDVREAEQHIEMLRHKIGEQSFSALLEQAEQQTTQTVEQALKMPL